MQEDATFRATLKRRDRELYYEIVSEITQQGPTKSCFECHEEGIECDEGTVRSGMTCLKNLKKLRKAHV